MTEEQMKEVVHLRHRLRAMAAVRAARKVDAEHLLARMVALASECGDADLQFEHARWSVQLSVERRHHRRAS